MPGVAHRHVDWDSFRDAPDVLPFLNGTTCENINRALRGLCKHDLGKEAVRQGFKDDQIGLRQRRIRQGSCASTAARSKSYPSTTVRVANVVVRVKSRKYSIRDCESQRSPARLPYAHARIDVRFEICVFLWTTLRSGAGSSGTHQN